MGKCKIKVIEIDLGTFKHNQAYPGIIQAYPGIFKTLCNPGIFRTVLYSESWYVENQKHIQNPGIFTSLVYSEPRIFRTLAYSKSEAYSEPCQTCTMNYFGKL